jgi:hypothetical protein
MKPPFALNVRHLRSANHKFTLIEDQKILAGLYNNDSLVTVAKSLGLKYEVVSSRYLKVLKPILYQDSLIFKSDEKALKALIMKLEYEIKNGKSFAEEIYPKNEWTNEMDENLKFLAPYADYNFSLLTRDLPFTAAALEQRYDYLVTLKAYTPDIISTIKTVLQNPPKHEKIHYFIHKKYLYISPFFIKDLVKRLQHKKETQNKATNEDEIKSELEIDKENLAKATEIKHDNTLFIDINLNNSEINYISQGIEKYGAVSIPFSIPKLRNPSFYDTRNISKLYSMWAIYEPINQIHGRWNEKMDIKLVYEFLKTRDVDLMKSNLDYFRLYFKDELEFRLVFLLYSTDAILKERVYKARKLFYHGTPK